MPLLENIHKNKISVIGLGYVGLPLAYEFSKITTVIGFDNNDEKINLYKAGYDLTGEVGIDTLKTANIDFTINESRLKEAIFHVIAVPTPVKSDHTPDLSSVLSASETLGRNLQKGSIVVYESTVYPGVTENICVPILEKYSGLKCGRDFKVGYSPERINPGDKIHSVRNIRKIVSGIDEEALSEISSIYELIIEAGTYAVSNIKTAEAIKVVENSQRDINIAFMNELAMVFDRMGIDTNEVVDDMNTKWNALGFRPGLVGGHCIGVDPFYFIYEAERLGYHSQIVLNGRVVNDGMGTYIADIAVKKMIEGGQTPGKSKVVILGFTFKENCSDIRNSRVFDIIRRLKEFSIIPEVVDPRADPQETRKEYEINLHDYGEIGDADCIIVAVAHTEFRTMGLEAIKKKFKTSNETKNVLLDVKGIFDRKELADSELIWWRL